MFNIIPQPVSVLFNADKKGFTLHSGTTISPFPFAEDLISFARSVFNKKIIMHEDTGEERSIILKIDESVENDEGYTIKCENRRVYINAKTEAGLFYGLQTLKQLLLQTGGKIPYTEITDYPRFSYRGLLLDLEKSNWTQDEANRFISLMSLHKMNVLRLCNADACYNQDELAEIKSFCEQKNIKVITDGVKASDKINRNLSPYALDYPYGKNTLRKVCEDDGALTDDAETIGLEARLCTRYTADRKRLDYLSFPRLGAVAENAWAEKGYPSFATFLHKSDDYYKLLDAYKVSYAPIKKACPSFVYKYASTIKFKFRDLGR